MIKTSLYKWSQKANAVISTELQKRIPFFTELRADNGSNFVNQIDLFGNVDTIISLGGTRLYKNQNKSRSDNKNDICIVCMSYRSKTINPETHKCIPIAGAYWYDIGKRWLTPRWGDMDILTVHLPGPNFTGHFNRYFLEIMFCYQSTWEKMTGIHKVDDDSNSYIIFYNYKTFCDLYMQTVAKVSCGMEYTALRKPKTTLSRQLP